VQVSNALVSDPPLPSIDSEEVPPVFGGGRGRVGLCGYGRGRARERERGREAAAEREKEKVIPSQIIPAVQKMMAYLVWCGYGRGRATEKERERGREAAVASGVVLLRAVRRIKINCFCSHFILLLQADLALIYWWANPTPPPPPPPPRSFARTELKIFPSQFISKL
jgi:hypothetical protein